MLSAEAEKRILLERLQDFAGSRCRFEDVERTAFDIRERWAAAPSSTLPVESKDERALWAAVWEITSACREALVSSSGEAHPVLQHIGYLDGSEGLPDDWTAKRP